MISRILVIGAGAAGRKHLKILQEKYPVAVIKVLRRPDSKPNLETENFTLTTWDEVVEFNPIFAIIAGPAPFHLKDANKLLRLGVHMIIEKPLSIDTRGVGKFLAKCEERGLTVLVGYNLRYMGSLNFLKQTLESNKLGEIYSIRAEVGQDLKMWRKGANHMDSVSASKKLGGGALLELSHELDYLIWLFGNVSSVNAKLTTVGQMPLDVENLAHIWLHFRRGKSEPHLTASLTLDMLRIDPVRSCTVVGEFGTLVWDVQRGEVKFFGTNQEQELFSAPNDLNNSYSVQLDHFERCMLSGSKPLTSILGGYRVLEVISAARKSSSRRGKVIKVEQLATGPKS